MNSEDFVEKLISCFYVTPKILLRFQKTLPWVISVQSTPIMLYLYLDFYITLQFVPRAPKVEYGWGFPIKFLYIFLVFRRTNYSSFIHPKSSRWRLHIWFQHVVFSGVLYIFLMFTYLKWRREDYLHKVRGIVLTGCTLLFPDDRGFMNCDCCLQLTKTKQH